MTIKMEARSFESPMDWEYQDRGPLDPTSPFAQAAAKIPRNIFGSPSRSSIHRGTPLPSHASPSTSHAIPPQTSRFTPQLSSRQIAPPFRNPAFTTPRRPVDEVILSEASGAEESPALSDRLNDTPEAEYRADPPPLGPAASLRINKTNRYAKAGLFPKKHAAGKGELQSNKEKSIGLRKRKRHNLDRDVGSVWRRRHSLDSDEWDSDPDLDPEDRSERSRGSTETRQRAHKNANRGPFESFFYALNKYPNTPDHMQRWMQLGANLFLVLVLAYLGWSVVSTVRSDISRANELARQELISKMTECQTQYTLNECARKDRPALRALCDEWYDCMLQDPQSIMRVKVTAKQVAEIINEFSETMHLKAWGIMIAFILVCTTVNVGSLSRHSGHNSASSQQQTQTSKVAHEAARPPAITLGYMLVPVQTPRRQRHALLDEGSDTDTSPLPSAITQNTLLGRRSPSKGERQMSSVKQN